MLVEVIQLRATGMKLTPEELVDAKRHRGNLTIYGGTAYLHRGEHAGREHVLTPLNRVVVKKVVGDVLLLHGHQPADYMRSAASHPQAWACYRIDGPPEPSAAALPRSTAQG